MKLFLLVNLLTSCIALRSFSQPNQKQDTPSKDIKMDPVKIEVNKPDQTTPHHDHYSGSRDPATKGKVDGGGGGGAPSVLSPAAVAAAVLAKKAAMAKKNLKVLDLLRESSRKIQRRASQVTVKYKRSGGLKQRQSDFDQFEFEKVTTPAPGIKMGSGRIGDKDLTVKIRESPQSGPTLEVITEGAGLKVTDKFRYYEMIGIPSGISTFLGEASSTKAVLSSFYFSMAEISFDNIEKKVKVFPNLLLSNVDGKNIRVTVSVYQQNRRIIKNGAIAYYSKNYHFDDFNGTIGRETPVLIPYSDFRVSKNGIENIRLHVEIFDESTEEDFAVLIGHKTSNDLYFDTHYGIFTNRNLYTDVSGVSIKVKSELLGKEKRKNWFQYEITFPGIEKIKERISKVVCKPNHYSFDEVDLSSFQKSNNFSITWNGYGCVSDVDVFFYFDNNVVKRIKFNLCETITEL